ncbi:MAG TPA: molybdate ABC transporter substrate-binding protein [Nocardioidaceae bacterium]|nr:molybdate ABC transporter substrate-binding protein [Nocardioidaceae bacterium]
MAGLAAGLAAVLALATGCGGSSHASTTDEVVVFAAASLTEPFQRMADEVEAKHPGLDVTLSFGGSSSLAPQIVSGAPADVFASASPDTMQLAIDGGAVAEDPVLFAHNRLLIAVPVGNPAGIEKLADLADPDLKLALCAPEVPCGAAAQKALKSGDVVTEPVTFETDVKAVLSKVLLGEVDAGLVYRTDVLAADGQVVGLEFEESAEAVNYYAIAPLTEAPNPEGAQMFIEFVQSKRGRAILRDAGFGIR